MLSPFKVLRRDSKLIEVTSWRFNRGLPNPGSFTKVSIPENRINGKCMQKFFALVLMFALASHAENFLERIGWRQASLTLIAGLLVVIAVILIFLALYYYRRTFIDKKEKHLVDEEQFEAACDRTGVTATEKSKIRNLMRHENMMQPQVIFQSVSVFEKCIDMEVKRVLSAAPGDEVLQSENNILSSIRRKAGFQFIPQEHPLASTRNIALGQVGAVFGANHRVPVISRVSMVEKDEFTFVLQYDADKEDQVKIEPGNLIKFAFTRQGDGMYGIQVRVKEVEAGSLRLFHTLELRRNQLRQFLRVDLNLPIKIRMLKTADPKNSALAGGEIMETHMADVSGGGLSFLCEKSLKPGDVISVSFSLPAGSFSGVMCKVLRIGLQEGKTRTLYRHHIQFVNLETRKRDLIVKYVFEKQRQINQWR
jgi:c-di-GMP-binding flagellar brake protein YcgR